MVVSNDEIIEYIDKLEDFINNLNKIHNDFDIHELFRELHSIKALTYTLEYTEISTVLRKTENILMFIINYDCDSSQILEWIFNLREQLDVWLNELKKEEELSNFYLYFENMPLIKCDTILKSVENRIIFIPSKNTQDKELNALILQKVKNINVLTEIKDIIKTVKENDNRIIIQIDTINDYIIKLVSSLRNIQYTMNNIYILINLKNELDFNYAKRKLNVKNLININNLSLNFVVNSVYSELIKNNYVKIPSSRIGIKDLVNKIRPISSDLIRLKDLCFSYGDSNEIVSIINSNSLFSGTLLKNINTPHMGLQNKISKVALAVSILGTKRVGGIILSEIAKKLFNENNLISYNIDIIGLLSLSQVRARFVTEWLKYLDISGYRKDDLVALMHLLPLGKILTNEALKLNNSSKRFKDKLNSTNHIELENMILGYSSYSVVTDMLELWKIPEDIVKMCESLSYYTKNSEKSHLSDSTNNIFSIIILISTELFTIDGNFELKESCIKLAKDNNLAPDEMKKMFFKITNDKKTGNIFTDIKR